MRNVNQFNKRQMSSQPILTTLSPVNISYTFYVEAQHKKISVMFTKQQPTHALKF